MIAKFTNIFYRLDFLVDHLKKIKAANGKDLSCLNESGYKQFLNNQSDLKSTALTSH